MASAQHSDAFSRYLANETSWFSSSGSKTSSICKLNSRAILNASGKLGSYLPVSIGTVLYDVLGLFDHLAIQHDEDDSLER